MIDIKELAKSPIFPQAKIVEKAWGREIWIHNSELYCGKVLQFNKDAQFSMHFHVNKIETWYVQTGSFTLMYINTDSAEHCKITLSKGDVIHLERGIPHQLTALEFSEIFEVSTTHYDEDSYRIIRGDSQKI